MNYGSDRPDKDNGQWDRWNSNASNSSYYNQPTHRPYNQGFAIASLVLGLLSVTLGCCGLSIPLGAMGILLRRGNLSAPGRPGPYLCPSCPQTGKARKFHLPSGAGVFLGGPGLCRRPADLLPGNAAFADEKRSLSGQVRQDDGAGVRHGLPGIHGNGLWILY